VEDNYRYFSNKNCKYFPCHPQAVNDEFNCLFCYCPLYGLDEQCGGSFEYVRNIKICVGCRLPHIPESYDIIVAKLKEKNKRGHNADSK